METEKFDLWCMVELFGHQRIAGRCTEQNVAGTNMLRVDVPETKSQPAFTRFLSSGAIYAISPVSLWDVKKVVESEILRLGHPEVIEKRTEERDEFPFD